MAYKHHIVIDARIRQASTGRYVDRLLNELAKTKTGFHYTVLVEPSDKLKIPSAGQRTKFQIVPCRFRQFSFNPLTQVLFAWQLYRLKPDLVHFTMTGQQPLFYFGKQITFTHDLTMLRYARRGRLPRWLHAIRMRGYRLLLWAAHRQAEYILVPSDYVRTAVKKYHLFVRRKIDVTYEAADPPVETRSTKPEIFNSVIRYTKYEIRFLLYVGSAFPHKNLKRLIKAFAEIRKKQPDLKLVLAGKREYHSKNLEKWAGKNDLAEGVIFTGFVSEPELKWLYENAECYVFPSLSEGFGLPGLEAMTHGCPVVSSDATCLPEIYGDAAHYFDPKSVDYMAESVAKVINNEKFRKDLIKKGHKQVKKYDWQKTAAQTLETYNSLLSP